MSKKSLILIFALFHLNAHAKSMLVNPLDPLSDTNLINEFFVEVVRITQEQPHKINDTNKDGYTLLQQALINNAHIEEKVDQLKHTNGVEQDILENSIMTIKVLLNNGADPNILFPEEKLQKKEKQHFLIKATQPYIQPYFPLHIIELLFEYHLNGQVRDPHGNSTLMRLIALLYFWKKTPEYRQQFIQLMLNHTSNIDDQNNNKETALHLTSKFNDLQTAPLLIQNGAQLNIKDAHGSTPEETAKFMAGLFPTSRSNLRWYWYISLSSTSFKMVKLLQEAERLQQENGSDFSQHEKEKPLKADTPTKRLSAACARVFKLSKNK